VLSDRHEPTCYQFECLLPGDSHKRVLTTREETVTLTQFRAQWWKAGLGPFLPSLAHHGILQAIRAIDAPMDSVALVAAARMPMGRWMEPIQTGVGGNIIGWLNTHHDPIALDSHYTTGMGAVGGTYEAECAIVCILVSIEIFPISVWIEPQRIADLFDSAKPREYILAPKASPCCCRSNGQELPTCQFAHLLAPCSAMMAFILFPMRRKSHSKSMT